MELSFPNYSIGPRLEASVHGFPQRDGTAIGCGTLELNPNARAHTAEDLSATIDLIADRRSILSQSGDALLLRLALELSSQHGDGREWRPELMSCPSVKRRERCEVRCPLLSAFRVAYIGTVTLKHAEYMSRQRGDRDGCDRRGDPHPEQV